MLTPTDAFKISIERWEGLYQDDPKDIGNHRLSNGRIVGTMRGVTPRTWASFLNRPLDDITPEMMKAISLIDAARVYEQKYYKEPGFAFLEWGPTVEVLCDIGWGSGPVRGIRAIQTLSGAPVDGAIGAKTIAAHKSWLAEIGDAAAVDALAEWRRQWYRHIVQVRPTNGKFLKGWLRRADWQSTKSPWWTNWQATAQPPTEPEPVPSAPQRQAVQSIEDRVLEALDHEAAKAVFTVFPALGIAAALLKRLFG